MIPRSHLIRRPRLPNTFVHRQSPLSSSAIFFAARRISPQPSSSSSPQPPPASPEGPNEPYQYVEPTRPPETWLATYLKTSPRAMKMFKTMAGILGMGSPKQVAGRHTFHMYRDACIERESVEKDFWQNECRLPPTFQSWFTVTNLHVWMLTVRFRALPPPYGAHYVQGLVDHFFLDVEDRIRQVLSRKAPERLVTRQMKVFREQWTGLGLSFDYSLGLSSPYASSMRKDGDVEMAAAVWRNLLGARGAQGVDDPGTGKIRRAINISGKADAQKISIKLPEESLRKLEGTDDGSGVYDFSGEDTMLYVKYPELMRTIVAYIRRELARLECQTDEQIMSGRGVGEFGRIRVLEDG